MTDAIATLLPKPDILTHYEITIEASPERVYQVARDTPMMGVNLARRMLWLRALPARFDAKASSEDSSSFLLIREEGTRETVWGMAGRFWHPSRNIIRLPDAKAWLRYAEQGSAKAAINCVVERVNGKTRLSTETRVLCFGTRSRRTFRLYWLIVAPFSGWIRKRWLKEVKQKATQAGIMIEEAKI
jgi:hypothetical protein